MKVWPKKPVNVKNKNLKLLSQATFNSKNYEINILFFTQFKNYNCKNGTLHMHRPFLMLVQVFKVRRSQTFLWQIFMLSSLLLWFKDLAERLTINRSQSDGAEQPCDDANGGHLRFPLVAAFSSHNTRLPCVRTNCNQKNALR